MAPVRERQVWLLAGVALGLLLALLALLVPLVWVLWALLV